MASSISVISILNNVAIVQNNSVNGILDLARYSTEGFFSAQIEVVGAGNVTLTYAISNNGDDYITPTGTSALFTAFGASSGESSDGKSIVSFDPPLCRFLKIIATEQNAGAISAIDVWMAIQ